MITAPQIIDLPLKLDGGRLSLSLERPNYVTFASYNVVKNEAHFVVKWPLYNFIRNKSQSLLEIVVLGSLKSFFQLDHEVDISLSHRLLFSATLAGLTPT